MQQKRVDSWVELVETCWHVLGALCRPPTVRLSVFATIIFLQNAPFFCLTIMLKIMQASYEKSQTQGRVLLRSTGCYKIAAVLCVFEVYVNLN